MSNRQDQHVQDLDALAGLLGGLSWDMPTESQQRLKDHLVAEIRRAEPSESGVPGRWRLTRLRRRAWLIVGTSTALAGLTAAAIAISVTFSGGLPPPSPAAVQLLAKVAAAAASRPAVPVSGHQYMFDEVKTIIWPLPGNLEPYIRKGSLPQPVRLRLEKIHPQKSTMQVWSPVSDVCRTGLERFITPAGRVDDAKFSAGGPGTKCPSMGGLNDASYRLLQTLPTDPHTLLAMIYKVEQGHGPGPDQEAFVTIGDLLRDKIAPPKVAAALYRAVALIPGVTLIPSATDAIGRQGVAVARTADGIRTELIFSKTSLRLLGERTILAGIGVSASATAIIRQAFASHLGKVPPRQPRHHG